MSKENVEKYIAEINLLKEEYKGKIDILLGLEQEYFSDICHYPFDFTIGSAHAVKIGDRFFTVDDEAKEVENTVNKFFGGDYYRYAEEYFKIVSDIPNKLNPSVIGHFDLITKFNEGYKYFDETNIKYLTPAYTAIEEIVKYDIPFEINTGAMYKGYKKNPYPSKKLLKRICELGGQIVLSSDSHNADSLGYKFDEVSELAKEIGFKSAKILKFSGFEDVIL